MKIALLIEGKTEMAFRPHLLRFLQAKLAGQMPRLQFHLCHGRIPKEDKLRRVVEMHLNDTKNPADAVIALTDVYTGTGDFTDARDAKAKMRSWVGPNESFYPHAAQYDFEAWLLPFWNDIQTLAGHNKGAPGADPESVNHLHPPAFHIQEIFRIGRHGRTYVKPRDAGRILRNKDLLVAALACPELKEFLDTILQLSGSDPIS